MGNNTTYRPLGVPPPDEVLILKRMLGFDPLNGGRRTGELRCTHPTTSGQVYLEITGTYVTVKQAQAIRKVLLSERPRKKRGKSDMIVLCGHGIDRQLCKQCNP